MATGSIAKATLLENRPMDEPEDIQVDAYSLDEAMNLAGLWEAGKLIGGDAHEVAITLYREILRLREPLKGFGSWQSKPCQCGYYMPTGVKTCVKCGASLDGEGR